MIDATGNPQTILLLGGTSDIGLAIVREYLAKQTLRVIVAARPSPRRDEATAGLRSIGATVDVLDFDATAFDSHPGVIDAAWAIADVDLAIVAFGLLGDAEQAWQDHAAAVALAQVNYTGGVSVGVLLGQRMKEQGYGQIIALSSVAGEIVRRSNFVYGSTKAGFDGFYRLLGEALEPFGPKVLVVRPGQVRTKMLDGVKEGPGAIAPEVLARTVVDAARDGRTLIWAPAFFRPMMWVLKHLPAPIFRRLPI
ncbi:MAG: decaprenylphospho-beta-D-erythro-pentofuranosid-2-ulose 2-reductase [Actinobacteria bacterium]|nr:decaprenylphospho-beta-D-erythro-pentofuranosid-2-ulose 2-reductase [Actinomycetota bacterium]